MAGLIGELVPTTSQRHNKLRAILHDRTFFFTALFSFIAIVSGATLLVLIYLDNRNVRIDDGIANFRRHIDALSPEARQSSVHRNNQEDRRN